MSSPLVFDFDTDDTRWDIAEKLKVIVENNPDLCRAIRKQTGLSQKELAYELDCSQSTVSQIERGAYTPSCDFATDYLLMLLSLLPADDKLTEVMSEQDAYTFYNLYFYVKESAKAEKTRYKRHKIVSVDRGKLSEVLEGGANMESGNPFCLWPDCGWDKWGSESKHGGTCPLAQTKIRTYVKQSARRVDSYRCTQGKLL